MRFKPKEFRKNNYFIIYEYDEYLCNENCKDEIVCYLDNWKELHEKYLKNYRPNDLAKKFNEIDSNIITIFINNRKYKLATFSDFDEEIE